MRVGGRSSRKDSRQKAKGITGVLPMIPFELRKKIRIDGQVP
jgi:hypothetical protein